MSRWPWRRDPARRRMSCVQVARVLQSYLDGETDDITARRVAAHVEDCRRCGLETSVYREIKGALARRTELDPMAVARLRSFGESLSHGPGGPGGLGGPGGTGPGSAGT